MSKPIALLTLGLAAALAACSPQPANPPATVSAPATPAPSTPAPQSTPTAGSTPTVTLAPAATDAASPTPQPPAIDPLTGLPLVNPDQLGRRPILIKVSNFPRNNRPQWGLSRADMVFEHYAEGGLTRFTALFYGQEAELVGPIRSARFIDLELVPMYGGIFAYGSADYRVRRAIAESDFADRAVTEYPARCPPMCRVDPNVLNHLTTGTQALRDYLAEKGLAEQPVDLQGMAFSQDAPGAGLPGEQLEIVYSSTNFHRWIYDRGLGAYQRWQETGADAAETELLNDRLTGQPIAAANVILVVVPHTYITPDPEFVRIELEGEGRAIAFRDGRAFEIRWVRPASGVLRLETSAGDPFPLRPGQTWVELVNTSSEIEQRPPDGWWVRFHIP